MNKLETDYNIDIPDFSVKEELKNNDWFDEALKLEGNINTNNDIPDFS